MSAKQILAGLRGQNVSAFLRRNADDWYYDYAGAAFTVAGTGTPTQVMPQGTVNPDSYVFSLPTTPVSVFPDGLYTIEPVGGLSNRTFRMTNGSDVEPSITRPWGKVVSFSSTSLVLTGGTLMPVPGLYGPSGGSSPILGPRLTVTSGPAFGYPTPPNIGHGWTPVVGPTAAFHTFTFSANTPLLAAALAVLQVNDVVTLLV